MTKKEAKQVEDHIKSITAYKLLMDHALEKRDFDGFRDWCDEHDKVNSALRSMGINIGKTYKELRAERNF